MNGPSSPSLTARRARNSLVASIRADPTRLLPLGLLALVALVYRWLSAPPVPLSTLGQIPKRDARNWGEYVAFGHAREKLLKETDPTYIGFGERRHLVGYGVKKAIALGREGGGSSLLETGTGKGGIAGDEGFEFERHGLYGGAHWDWTTGIAGVGGYLGPLDMRKRSAAEASGLDASQHAGLEHYLNNAWRPPAEGDKPGLKHRAEVLEMSWDERSRRNLPLRDRALGMEQKEHEAAELWTRVYGAFHGSNRKGSVQVALERLVRRVPVVVFADGEDSERTQALRKLFKRLRVNPEVLVVDLAKRPDHVNVKAFLRQMTDHDTLPNVVIGGRCVGGDEDVAALESDGTLVAKLQAAGVTVYGSAFAIHDG